MIKNFISYPVQFILLVLLQILVLNNIHFSSFVNPYLYILFILWLPIEIPNWFLMVLSFLIGLVVDVFSDTLGMHTSACVFLAFIRPFVLNNIAPRDGYEPNQYPNINELGFSWFLIYISLTTLLHHIFLFFVEVFRFSDFFATLGRSLSSTLFSIILILITQFFHYNSASKK